MKYHTLGRTGLKVSEIGMGCGGKSCLGQKQGNSEKRSVQIVRQALEHGINILDTSERNGTEEIIGKAIQGFSRDGIILSTKKSISHGQEIISIRELSSSIEDSLKKLNTDYIDIFHFHGVLPNEYEMVVQEFLPVLQKIQSAGKIRYIGVTEAYAFDPGHKMLTKALADDYWDVMMVGFNMVNQSARTRVFQATLGKNIGVLGMYAVRRALTGRERFAALIEGLKQQALLSKNLDTNTTIDAILEENGNLQDLANVAYRYCRDETAIHSVLFGTGNPDHLVQNLRAFQEPSLSLEKQGFIERTFGHIDSVSCN